MPPRRSARQTKVEPETSAVLIPTKPELKTPRRANHPRKKKKVEKKGVDGTQVLGCVVANLSVELFLEVSSLLLKCRS